MNRPILFLILGLLIFSSCKKEEKSQQGSPATFRATINGGELTLLFYDPVSVY